MPLSVSLVLSAIFVSAVFVCLLVPVFLYLRRLYRHAESLPQPRGKSEELLGALLGLCIVDLVLYVMYRATLPRSFFYPAMANLDLFFLTFASKSYVKQWCYRRYFRRGITSTEAREALTGALSS